LPALVELRRTLDGLAVGALARTAPCERTPQKVLHVLDVAPDGWSWLMICLGMVGSRHTELCRFSKTSIAKLVGVRFLE